MVETLVGGNMQAKNTVKERGKGGGLPGTPEGRALVPAEGVMGRQGQINQEAEDLGFDYINHGKLLEI